MHTYLEPYLLILHLEQSPGASRLLPDELLDQSHAETSVLHELHPLHRLFRKVVSMHYLDP